MATKEEFKALMETHSGIPSEWLTAYIDELTESELGHHLKWMDYYLGEYGTEVAAKLLIPQAYADEVL